MHAIRSALLVLFCVAGLSTGAVAQQFSGSYTVQNLDGTSTVPGVTVRLDVEDHVWFVEVRVFLEFPDGTELESVNERRTAIGWPAPTRYDWENPARGSHGFYEYDAWDETYYGWTSSNGGMWRVYVPR